MGQPKDELGCWGEKEAVRYLKRLGLRILEENFASPLGEIDVIARDRDVLVFVEVKTRAEADFGGPLPAVNTRKRRKIVLVAKGYLARHRAGEIPSRFDVVGVTRKPGSPEPQIEYIRNAFTASGRTISDVGDK